MPIKREPVSSPPSAESPPAVAATTTPTTESVNTAPESSPTAGLASEITSSVIGKISKSLLATLSSASVLPPHSLLQLLGRTVAPGLSTDELLASLDQAIATQEVQLAALQRMYDLKSDDEKGQATMLVRHHARMLLKAESKEQSTRDEQEEVAPTFATTTDDVDSPMKEETTKTETTSETKAKIEVMGPMSPPLLSQVPPPEVPTTSPKTRTSPLSPSRRSCRARKPQLKRDCAPEVDDDDEDDADEDMPPVGATPRRQQHSPESPTGARSTSGTGSGLPPQHALQTPPRIKRGQGVSCHSCKTSKETTALFFCQHKGGSDAKKRRCRKKYCATCLKRSYQPCLPGPHTNLNTWICPSCLCLCLCANCVRRDKGSDAPLTGSTGPKKRGSSGSLVDDEGMDEEAEYDQDAGDQGLSDNSSAGSGDEYDDGGFGHSPPQVPGSHSQYQSPSMSGQKRKLSLKLRGGSPNSTDGLDGAEFALGPSAMTPRRKTPPQGPRREIGSPATRFTLPPVAAGSPRNMSRDATLCLTPSTSFQTLSLSAGCDSPFDLAATGQDDEAPMQRFTTASLQQQRLRQHLSALQHPSPRGASSSSSSPQSPAQLALSGASEQDQMRAVQVAKIEQRRAQQNARKKQQETYKTEQAGFGTIRSAVQNMLSRSAPMVETASSPKRKQARKESASCHTSPAGPAPRSIAAAQHRRMSTSSSSSRAAPSSSDRDVPPPPYFATRRHSEGGLMTFPHFGTAASQLLEHLKDSLGTIDDDLQHGHHHHLDGGVGIEPEEEAPMQLQRMRSWSEPTNTVPDELLQPQLPRPNGGGGGGGHYQSLSVLLPSTLSVSPSHSRVSSGGGHGHQGVSLFSPLASESPSGHGMGPLAMALFTLPPMSSPMDSASPVGAAIHPAPMLPMTFPSSANLGLGLGLELQVAATRTERQEPLSINLFAGTHNARTTGQGFGAMGLASREQSSLFLGVPGGAGFGASTHGGFTNNFPLSSPSAFLSPFQSTPGGPQAGGQGQAGTNFPAAPTSQATTTNNGPPRCAGQTHPMMSPSASPTDSNNDLMLMQFS